MSGYNFGKINLPGPAGTYIYISVSGVDAEGLAVGNYGDSNDDFHGFTADSGTPVIFDPPDSSNTDIGGITASGEIFGNYTSFQNQQVGFVYNNGIFTTVDAPLAQETTVFGVTNGEIFGGYVDLFGGSYGFVDNGGVFSQIAAPGAASTTVTGVTPSGEIAGTMLNSSDQAYGFTDLNGIFTTIDPAGSTDTYVVGISAAGDIAGTYYDSAQNSHGFVDANGVITTINIAGATATAVTGINAAGEVVGYSIDGGGNVHGFVDILGSVTTVDVPGATQTDILGVNDAGDIYGFYNIGSVQYGFVGTSTDGVYSPATAEQIVEIYDAVLQRAPTDAELTSQLSVDAASGISAVVSAVVDSAEAQTNVYPVLQAFQLAFDHFPTAATLSSIVSTGLTEAQFSDAFVSDASFARLYLPVGTDLVAQGGMYYEGGIESSVVEGGTTYQSLSSLPIIAGGEGESIIKELFQTGLGHLPTASTLAGFDGLTIGQAFLAFIQSEADFGSLQSSIVSYLTTAADNAAGIQTPVVGSVEAIHSAVA
jgi:hypothetical protein